MRSVRRCFFTLHAAAAVAILALGCATNPHAAPRPLPPGLVIEDTSPGAGEVVRAGDTVTMLFIARFADGTVYDSSDLRRRPLTITLSNPGLIRGLREGIPGMRVGGERTIRIPWTLAYGEHGRHPVPPKTDLVFEIEVLKRE